MIKFLTKFRNNENGATAIEYGLIAALIAIGLIGAIGGLEDQITAFLGGVGTDLTNSTAP